jgi:glycosyltransferase involved in cell wall biosynthesis
MLNEAPYVEQVVSDIAAQDFEGHVEVIVADGGSTDDSVSLMLSAAKRREVRMSIVENPAGWVSQGLNLCIAQANGDLLVRLDCHSRYPPDYLRLCAEASEASGAENVGGVVLASGRTAMERAVACAMDSAFGGIGWTRHESAQERVEVDTVTFGAFRPEAFRQAGLFDESLRRNQDDEFNLRLRRAGGRIILDPAIRLFYTPRGSIRAVFRQYFDYGRWKIPVMRKHRRVLGLRSLAPVVLVLSLLALVVAAALWRPAAWALVAEVVLYIAFAIVFGVAALRRRREPIRLLPRVLAAFAGFHIGYGLGMLRGLVGKA